MSGRTAEAPDGTTVGALVSEVASDVKRLLRQEVRLATSEIRAEARKAGTGVRLVGTGALLLHLTLVLASAAAALAGSVVLADRLADPRFAPAIAAGGVALVWLVVGLILLGVGRRRLRRFSPIPRQTIRTLKEDVAWLRKPTA